MRANRTLRSCCHHHKHQSEVGIGSLICISESQRSQKAVHQHPKNCPPSQLQPAGFVRRVNKGCQSFQSLVLPPGQGIGHGSEVHALEPLSLCLLHFALSIVSYFVCTWIYTLPRQLGTDRSVHMLSFHTVCVQLPSCNKKNKCAPLARISKHPRPCFLPPILRTDDLGLELKPGFGHITLIGDVRHHCGRITPDRSLGLKKNVKFLGRRKLNGKFTRHAQALGSILSGNHKVGSCSVVKQTRFTDSLGIGTKEGRTHIKSVSLTTR